MAYLVINPRRSKGRINPNIYGPFAEHLGRCIYQGIYVGNDSEIPNVNRMRCDVVNALKRLQIPVLRWPGGCFADTYHWRDGVDPQAQRKTIVNTNWGGVSEDNSFGTHEIIKRYQGERSIGLAVDEWGIWFDLEPGTNPGFLYQQNTMRDALAAAIQLNILGAALG